MEGEEGEGKEGIMEKEIEDWEEEGRKKRRV
jgi:hypothetical protein